MCILDPNDPNRTVRLDQVQRLDNPFFRVDANSLWFQKELEEVIASTYEVKYPELQFANGSVLAFRATIPRGKKTGSYKTVSLTGLAKWATTGAWKDIPKASVSAKRHTFEVHEFHLGTGWDIGDMEEAAAANFPLPRHDTQAVKRGCALFTDDVLAFGDAAKGLQGLTNLQGMSVVDAPAGAGGAYRWSTTGGTAKTAMEMVQDVALLIRYMRAVTQYVHRPSQILLPPSFWEATNRVVLANTSKTVRSFLRENYPEISFREINKLENAGTYGGPVILATAPLSPDELWAEEPIPFEMHGPWQDGFQFGAAARQSTGGVICIYPMAVLRMDFPPEP